MNVAIHTRPSVSMQYGNHHHGEPVIDGISVWILGGIMLVSFILAAKMFHTHIDNMLKGK